MIFMQDKKMWNEEKKDKAMKIYNSALDEFIEMAFPCFQVVYKDDDNMVHYALVPSENEVMMLQDRFITISVTKYSNKL